MKPSKGKREPLGEVRGSTVSRKRKKGVSPMYDEEPQKHRLRGTTPAAGRTDRLGYEDFSWDNPCA